MLTVLHCSFTINQRRGHMEPGFHWSLAIRWGKSASHSKHRLGSPPHAWAYSHAGVDQKVWMHPAVSTRHLSRCSSIARQTLTNSITTAWPSTGSAAQLCGPHTCCSWQQGLSSAPLDLHLTLHYLLKHYSAAGVCSKHRTALSPYVPLPFCNTCTLLHHSQEKSECKVLLFTRGHPPTVMEWQY